MKKSAKGEIDLKYDMGTLGEVEVPESLINIILDLANKYGTENCKKDCETCNLLNGCIHDFILEERFGIYPDNIYPEDIAEFTVDYFTHSTFFDRPTFSARKKVGDWVVIAYGVLPHPDDANTWEPAMLAYRK